MTMQPPQDFEVWTTDAATMQAAIVSLGGSWDGVSFPYDSPSGRFPNGDQFALHVYGVKYFAGVAQSGIFGIARYIPAQLGNTPPSPVGVIVIPLSQAVGAPAWESA